MSCDWCLQQRKLTMRCYWCLSQLAAAYSFTKCHCLVIEEQDWYVALFESPKTLLKNLPILVTTPLPMSHWTFFLAVNSLGQQ